MIDGPQPSSTSLIGDHRRDIELMRTLAVLVAVWLGSWLEVVQWLA
jgi:hypothetical protein